MLKLTPTQLIETSYQVQDEAKNATLFGIGNGYFGIRGSFEEFGDVYVQGTYVRGVFDRIIEIPMAISENVYMKRYYFDEQKLKEFEYEDCCINVCDFTSFKMFIDGQPVLPWTWKIASWRRCLNYADGSCSRRVIYENENGERTQIDFRKIACFHNPHLFIQELLVKPLNHSRVITVVSGVDTLVKTNGQKKSVVTAVNQSAGQSGLSFAFGQKYHQEGRLQFVTEPTGFSFEGTDACNGVYGNRYRLAGQTGALRKVVSFVASIDPLWNESVQLPSYEEALQGHLKRYRNDFGLFDMKIEKDSHADAALRYDNYQTLIGLDRFDTVHSLSAKNLTSEKYNQFVWWDCEIFQIPAFVNAFPEETKRALQYRLQRLDEARALAKKEGREGVRFAFCSSVTGEENVWPYARHPFLQIHITADVGYGLLTYFDATNDVEFLVNQALPCLNEILRYFVSRSTKVGSHFSLLNVTGCDEHHDYVDNDAYTNYEVHFLCASFLKLAAEHGYAIDEDWKMKLEDFRDHLYLPRPNAEGLIPQFDGYFALKSYLPLSGKGNPGFQMKRSGLYHLSQIIKQPDVLMLYSYLNIGLKDHYQENWRFYEKKCEASSSLTYPVHGICAVDNGDYRKFRHYFTLTSEMDFLDYFHGTFQGLHAGALAGARLMLTRGLAGLKNHEDFLEANPHYDSRFGAIRFDYLYHGAHLRCCLGPKGLAIKTDAPVCVVTPQKRWEIKKGETILVA